MAERGRRPRKRVDDPAVYDATYVQERNIGYRAEISRSRFDTLTAGQEKGSKWEGVSEKNGQTMPGGVNEISVGGHKLMIKGGKFRRFTKKEEDQTFHGGAFRIFSRMSVLEKEPISSFSRVFRAVLHSDVTGEKNIVVKITPADEKHQREAKIHFSVPHHKYIVERIATDVFNFRGQSSIYIAMEQCDCSLHDHIESQLRDGVPFDSQKYLSICRQIVVGLSFLHSNNVVHGDLKPGNVLLVLDKGLVKLCDFGLSRAVSDDNTSTEVSSPQGGTAGWQAPEVLEGTTKVGFKSDIFPLGLVMFHSLSYGKHPYGDEPVSWNHYIVKGKNRNLEGMLIPDAGSAKVLLEFLLKQNAADRPTADEVLKHPLFASEDKSGERDRSSLAAQLEIANVTLERCESGLRASWDAPMGSREVKYVVMLFCDGEDGENLFKTSSTSITFVDIQPSKRYHCKVVAYRHKSESGISNVIATKKDRLTTRPNELIEVEADPKNFRIHANKVTVLRGHEDKVWRCSWNPTCDLLASCSFDSNARIWDLKADARTGASPSGLVLQHGSPVWSLDWNHDGTLLATGSVDGFARIWAKDGRLLHYLNPDRLTIRALKWNKKGNYIVCGSDDKTTIIWDAQSGKLKQIFRFHDGKIYDIDWKDNVCFASCSSDRSIHVCQLGCKTPVKTFKGHSDEVNAVEWDPSKRFLASCSDDETVKIWSMKQDDFVHNFRRHSYVVCNIRWSPAGPGSLNPNQSLLLASASSDSTVRLWEPERGVCLHSLEGHKDFVCSISFSPDGSLLASGSGDNCVNIWNTQTGQLVRSYEGKSIIWDVCWNAAGTNVCAGADDGTGVVLDLRK